jgi:hypothetical protein
MNKHMKHVTLVVVDHTGTRLYCAKLFEAQQQVVEQLSTPKMPIILNHANTARQDMVPASELFGHLIGEPKSDPDIDTWTSLPQVAGLYGIFELQPADHRLFHNTNIVHYVKSE